MKHPNSIRPNSIRPNSIRQMTFVFLVLLVFTLIACVSQQPTPTFTPPPTPIPPTATPAATPTPLPPHTPLPEGVVAPVVVQRSPLPGEELPLDGVVELVFDRPMDKTSVEKAFQVSPALNGAFKWQNERTVRFEPTNLARGASYHVYLGQQARDTQGTILADAFRFRFSTVGYLQVAQVIPAPGSVDVQADSVITVIFNRPVVPLTTLAQQANLPNPLVLDPPIEGKGEWLNTSMYLWTPSQPLPGGILLTARVAAGLADTIGGVLENEYVWSFSTEPPKIVWTIPPMSNDRPVAPNTEIRITFNQAVDLVSATQAFSLQGGLWGSKVIGDFKLEGQTLTFKPREMLDFDKEYTVRVEAGVTGAQGGSGMREALEYKFTTVPLPRILRTEPADGEHNAPSYSSFSIVFNTLIDPTTVMPNLQMTPPLSPTQVYTYFSEWNYTFVLYWGAKPSTDYEVRIGPDIADPYGNKTGQRKTVQFRTAPLEPFARLHVSDGVSTANANDPARIFVHYVNTNKLDMALYRLSQDEFFAYSRDWYDFVPTNPLRQWRETVEAPPNEPQYARIELVEGGGRLEPGFYLIQVTSPDVKQKEWYRQHVMIVSPINLTLKTTQTEAMIWATDLKTGRPVPDLDLQMYDWYHNTRLDSPARTDANGLARLNVADPNLYYNIVVLSAEPFAAGSAYWNRGISAWEFGFGGGESAQAFRLYVDTDRPIYRAGQQVHFQGIVRRERDVAFTLPDVTSVDVTIYDVGGQTVLEKSLILDRWGAFSGDLELAAGAPLGMYHIYARAADSSFNSSFQVAAYRPPEFEVMVQPAQSQVMIGQRNTATVAVRYFFGGPVKDAAVQYNVLGETYTFEPPQFGRYSFADTDDPWLCRWCWWRPATPPMVLLSGNGVTDAQGNLVIDLPGEWKNPDTGRPITHSLKLIVEATVSGADGQVISGRGEVIAHRSNFYIGLAARQYVGQAEKEMTIDLITVDWTATRLPDKNLNILVYRREWKNVFVEDAVGGRWEWSVNDVPVSDGRITTGANGEAVFTFTPPQGGLYHVVAQSADGSPAARSSLFCWVSGREDVAWQRTNDDRFDLIADKGIYAPGETAEILIPSPFQGEQWAWITVERGGILSQEVLRLPSNSYVYRLPITSQHVPNIYVSVVIVKGQDADNPAATFKVGYTALTVSPIPQTLRIELSPNVTQAGPGDTVTFDVRVTDHTGEPVEAVFALDLVDKAVLSLMPRQPQAIVEAFYGRRVLGVNTASGLSISLNRLLIEQEKTFGYDANARVVADGMVSPSATPAPAAAQVVVEKETMKVVEAAPAPPPGVTLRQEFADTAFWRAGWATDRSGRGQVQVKLPDNLTTWVFRGVGLTAATQVGEATVDLLVTKPLLVRPVTPRFFVVDDVAYLSALVSNNTDQDLPVEVVLSSSGLVLQDPASQTITVAARGEGKVTWKVVVQDVPQVEVIFSAVSGSYSDAARPRLTTGENGTLLVLRYTAPETVGTGGQLIGEGARTEIIALPPLYDDRRGELLVQLDPSLAAGMQDGLKYLEHFPYECTEQTVSRFLPNVLTWRALKQLSLSNPELEAKLPSLVQEGLGRLYNQQRDDGGWGWWWQARESNPHITAYVILAMIKAREADFAVDENSLRRGLGYLNSQLVLVRRIVSYREANLQAFILYVLSEAGQTAQASEYTGGLFENREKLSHYGKAFLALALNTIRSGDERVKTILSDLNNAAILSATGAHWEEQHYDYWAMNTDTRSTAVILDALARLDAQNQLIPNVVRWLMVARKDGIWETTQETAWSLIALTDWMAQTGELKGNYEYAVALNGNELASGTVNSDNIDESVKLRVAIADLLGDQGNYMHIGRGAGDGRLYYTAHLRVYLPVQEIEPAYRGIIIYREYANAACTPAQDQPCPDVQEIRVGDTVRVKLTIIAPHDLYYVMVEDPLPAGGEAIDPKLATTSLLEQNPTLRRQANNPIWRDFYTWWWRWYSRSELRDDRVVLFADYLPQGTYEYTYTFRATLPGEYHVIPAVASEMYFPEVFGRSDGRLLSIAPQ